MEFLQNQYILTMISVKANAVFSAVIRNTADASGVMLCKNSPCLACSARAVKIGHLQLAVFGAVFLFQNGLTKNLDVSDSESKLGVFVNYIHNGFTFPKLLYKRKHFRRFLLLFGGKIAPFLKGSDNGCFRLGGIGPFSAFGDIVAVCPCAAVGLFDMCRGKARLNR